MSINMSETTLGYLIIALGILMGVGMIFGILWNNKTGSESIIRLKHLLAPPIIIAVGAGFVFGFTDRSSSRPCELKPGETFCLPGASNGGQVTLPRRR
jgi:predicted membrane protein